MNIPDHVHGRHRVPPRRLRPCAEMLPLDIYSGYSHGPKPPSPIMARASPSVPVGISPRRDIPRAAWPVMVPMHYYARNKETHGDYMSLG